MVRAICTWSVFSAVIAGALFVSPSDSEAGRRHRRNRCCDSGGYSHGGHQGGYQHGGYQHTGYHQSGYQQAGYGYADQGCCGQQAMVQQPMTTCCTPSASGVNYHNGYNNGMQQGGYASPSQTTAYPPQESAPAPVPSENTNTRPAPPPAAPEPGVEAAPEPQN